ncbi:receptor kinase At4g00960 [Olea europaea subsp. europaea]|uniref:non-specific serine/threonine protein kinase n=1 Tax=Olea europaea subsp. europaea TaxID=158383 RepID=A0A8S0V5C7_OLEEU|nr:receptor kinase At4g00960 [Olea europaea subsp. europaea]
MVQYSNETIFGTLAYSSFDWGYSEEKVSNLDKFYQELNILLDSLRNQTAYNSSPKKFAAASRVNRDYETAYAFEQCTPDITPKECDDCLKNYVLLIRECCDEAAGVGILRPSCYLCFGTDFNFYNETIVEILKTIASPMPPPLPSPPPPPPGKEDNTTQTVIIVIVPIVVCLILGLCVGIIPRTKKTRKPLEKIENNETSTIKSLQYDFSTIRTATENVSDANKLGQGGFGVVYKGKMPKGIEIAVKRLSKDLGQGDLEFKNEVFLLTRLQHGNLVRLLGFSVEGRERLLIYEWVQNGSLDRFIFDPNKHPYLDWGKHYIIIAGVAKGLLYLHEDSRLRIIHHDLKASNVLLDGEMKPKISDFGMARLFVPKRNSTQN